MLEPSKPVTLKARYTPYPAVQLQSDEGSVLRPGSVILRHRYLKRQFTIVPSSQRPPALAPPQCSYQVVAPAPAVPAVVPPSALPTALSVGAGPGLGSVAPPRASCSTGSSVGAGPSVTNPPLVSSPVVPTAPAAIPPAIAAPSGANTLVASTIASGSGAQMQPLPVQESRRNTTRSHEVVETSNSSLVVKRGQHAIRDKKGQTIWFYSEGQTYLLEPPILESARLGDLYVHTAANRDQQIWIFNRSSQWEKIQLYHPHPVLSGYVLHRVRDSEPRWIQKTTVTTYKGREKRYRQICRNSADSEVAPVASSGQAARLADTI